MSAWLVSKPHIDALVTYAIDNKILALNATDVGRELWFENRRSLRYRYDDADKFWPELRKLHGYQYAPAYVSHVEIVKAAHCYAYQACEHPQWDQSKAKALTDAIEAYALARLGTTYDAISNTPAYNAAPWGLEEKEVQRDALVA